MRDSIRYIEEYTRGGRDTFFGQRMVQDAVLRRLENLGDSSHRLPDVMKARHPDIPWGRIYGFRNIAAHDYERIDLERAWEIVERHLPRLKAAVSAEIMPLPKGGRRAQRLSDSK